MLKLKTILELRETINEQVILLNTLMEDYLDLIDDDLYTIDLKDKPSFTDEFYYEKLMVDFTVMKKPLTDKYLQRFMKDFGLQLVSLEEKDNCYNYLFEVQKEE